MNAKSTKKQSPLSETASALLKRARDLHDKVEHVHRKAKQLHAEADDVHERVRTRSAVGKVKRKSGEPK